MFNKFKYLLLALIVISLFLPRPASAIFGTGVFDLFDHMLHGISEKTGPMAALIIVILFFYLVGLMLLWASGFVLEAFIAKQADWMAGLQGMTEAGWNFTAGIANLALIIIFLVIAFAFIFKIETLQAKKSLPKLIIVAILLNFSLLFVNMLVDISQVAYNTILEAMPAGLIARVTTVLVMPLLFTIASIMALVVAMVIAWSIPIASAFAQILFAALFIPFILPALALVGIQMLLFFPVIFMFLTYVFLFGARVFVIQLLTMMAPLAFVCLILPQTKKYWDDWFQHLVQWLLLGIVVLFFLALGFSALDALKIEPGDIIPAAGTPGILQPFWFMLESIVFLAIFYFGVFIYLMAIFFVSQKYMPAFASFLIDQGKAMAGNIWSMGLKPFGGAAAYHWKKGLAESKWVQEKAGKEAMLKTPDLKGGKKILAPAYALRRSMGRALGPGLAEARNKEIAAAEQKISKISTPEMFKSKFLAARSDDERIAYFSAAIQKGGIFKDTLTDDKHRGLAIKAATRANEIGMVPEAERITRGIFDDRLTEADLKKMGFKSYQDIASDPKKKAEWDAKEYKTIADKLIGDTKPNEVADFSKNFWKSPDAEDAIHKFWRGPHLFQAAEKFGRVFLDDFQSVANNKGIDWYKSNNPRLAKYLSSSAAHALGLETPPSIPMPPGAPGVLPTSPSVPPGVPSGWVPGPGGTWVPPPGTTQKPPRGTPGTGGSPPPGAGYRPGQSKSGGKGGPGAGYKP